MGGLSAPLHAGIHTPLGRNPSPQGRHPPPWADTPRQIPPAQYMLGYGQQAGGTHGTGMHSRSLPNTNANIGNHVILGTFEKTRIGRTNLTA